MSPMRSRSTKSVANTTPRRFAPPLSRGDPIPGHEAFAPFWSRIYAIGTR